MFTRTAAALVVSAALTASSAFSQTAPNPTQQAIANADGPVPTFRITVVGRTTPAINYRPRRGDTTSTSGTPLLPQAHGVAKVAGEQGYMKIDAHFEKLDAGVALRSRVPHLRPLGHHAGGTRQANLGETPGGRCESQGGGDDGAAGVWI